MRRWPVLLLAAPLAITLVASAPAQAAKRRAHPSCSATGTKTLRRTRDVRISAKGNAYYGCLTAVGRQVRFFVRSGGDFSAGEDITAIEVAGRYVAWVAVNDSGCSKYDQCPPGNPDGQDATVTSFDLRNRRRARTFELPVPPQTWVVAQNGGLAVLSDGTLTGVDSAGPRTLDAGNIAGRSLRAEISIVSWVRDGVERFARLR